MRQHFIAGLCCLFMLSPQVWAESMTTEQASQRLRNLSQQISTSPQDALLLVKRGDIHFQLHEFEQAVDDYSAALAIDPELAEAWFGRGMALGRTGKVHEGIAALSRFLVLRPQSSVGYTKRGVRHLWIGEREQAERDLQKAIDLNPANAEAHDDLGVIYAQKGDVKTALSHFKLTIKHDPNYQKGYHNLALGYFIASDASTALNYINRAIQLQANNRNSLLLKAEILTALGRNTEASVVQEEAEYLPEGNWSEEAPTPKL